jgi:hydroxyacyl-ACP dehydratase HTD2-like protein with hotdog domain
MIDRSLIGFETKPSSVVVDPWRVKLFCQAIGESDSSAWQVGCVLPPTYLKAMEGEHFSSADLMQLMRVPLRGVLHAEQSFEHFAPVRVGDKVEVQRVVADIHDKKDGALTFIVVDTRYGVAGRTVAASRQTILVRHALAAT